MGLAVLVLCSSACASAGPFASRLTVVYEQDFQRCRFQIVRDTRSSACFLFVRCGREWRLVPTDAAACVP